MPPHPKIPRPVPPRRRHGAFAVAFLLGAAVALAGSRVIVTVGAPAGGQPVPRDFIGLSFEISNLRPDATGFRLFSPANRPLVDLFREVGIGNLRVGGGTTDPKTDDAAADARFPMPDRADIDALFAFAEAADVRIIYTLRLLRGQPPAAADTARYIAERYARRLDSFAIGNEPDWHAFHSTPGRTIDPRIFEPEPGVPGSAYPSYLARWREFAVAITAAVPGAKLSGPDTGSNHPVAGALDTTCAGKSWTLKFAEDLRPAENLVAVTAHDYVGQSADGVSIPAAITAMLSREWVQTHYPALHDAVLAPVQALGRPYRMTECNDHTGGVDGASNAFVSALWALDYLHWHAARGAVGLNFHNKRWIQTCTIVMTPQRAFRLNPKAYGLKAFSLGGRGRTAPVTLRNPDAINLTAYALVDGRTTYLTLINKEHGDAARRAAVTVDVAAAEAALMALQAPHHDPRARTGITLGGAPLGNDGRWAGDWTAATLNLQRHCTVTIEPTSAVILRLTAP